MLDFQYKTKQKNISIVQAREQTQIPFSHLKSRLSCNLRLILTVVWAYGTDFKTLRPGLLHPLEWITVILECYEGLKTGSAPCSREFTLHIHITLYGRHTCSCYLSGKWCRAIQWGTNCCDNLPWRFLHHIFFYFCSLHTGESSYSASVSEKCKKCLKNS